MDEYVWLKRASAAAQSVLDSYSGVGQSADIPLASDEIPHSLLKANIDEREPDREPDNDKD